MASLPDMRECFKELGEIPIKYALMAFWPGSDGDDENMSAMDCAVVIVRVVVSHLVDLGRSLGHSDCELGNEFFRFAMSNFTAETAMVQLARETMFAKIKQEWGITEPITFVKLIESAPMIKSLWSMDGFGLFLPIMWRRDKTQWKWFKSEAGRLTEAEMSLLQWSTNEQGSDPAGVIDNTFGVFEGDDETEYQMYSGSPCILRVAFEHGSDHLGLHELQTLVLPMTSRKVKRTLTNGDRITHNHDDSGSTYRLAAVVKLRDGTDDQHDRVRLYMTDILHQVEPHGDATRREGFVDESWTIADEGKYMLYYVRHTGAVGDPFVHINRGTADELEADLNIWNNWIDHQHDQASESGGGNDEEAITTPGRASLPSSQGFVPLWSLAGFQPDSPEQPEKDQRSGRLGDYKHGRLRATNRVFNMSFNVAPRIGERSVEDPFTNVALPRMDAGSPDMTPCATFTRGRGRSQLRAPSPELTAVSSPRSGSETDPFRTKSGPEDGVIPDIFGEEKSQIPKKKPRRKSIHRSRSRASALTRPGTPGTALFNEEELRAHLLMDRMAQEE